MTAISVFAYVGTIGPVYLIEESDKYHLGPNTSKITLNESISSEFMFLYFNSWLIKNEIVEHTSIGAQPSLSMTKIRNFKIVLPPTKAEQTAIATVLSDADALLQSLEKLIAKKRNIKQGAMQKLLKPKAGWEEDKIKNLAYITTGDKNTQDRIEDGRFPFFVRSQTVERINSYSFDGEAVLTAGDGVGTGKIFH